MDAQPAGTAEAFGLLLGADYLAAAVNGDQFTAAKRLVFGTSGTPARPADCDEGRSREMSKGYSGDPAAAKA